MMINLELPFDANETILMAAIYLIIVFTYRAEISIKSVKLQHCSGSVRTCLFCTVALFIMKLNSSTYVKLIEFGRL